MKLQRLFQIVLLIGAADSLACGLWAWFQPEKLFDWLQFTMHAPIETKLPGVKFESADEVLLWRALGVIFLAHSVLLVLAAWRPRRLGSLVYVPLIGRALLLGLWLWLLGSDRIELSSAALRWLAAHEGVWIVFFVAFLVWDKIGLGPERK